MRVTSSVVGLLAKRQLQAEPPRAGGLDPSVTPAPPGKALQGQAADGVTRALDAGRQRNREAEGAK